MRTIDTVCGECSLGCSAQAWKKQTEVLRLTPRIDLAVNEYWLCDKGRFGLHKHLTPDRLIAAHKPGNGTTLVSPDQVAAMIASDFAKVPAGDMAFVADASLTNEEFFRLRGLAKTLSGKVYAPVAREVRELSNKLKASGIDRGFPAKLEEAKTVLILGGRLEEEQPVLVLRLRRLNNTYRTRITTAGSAAVGFADIRESHTEVPEDPDAVVRFFEKLASAGKPDASTFVFLTDRWVNARTLPAILRWLGEARDANEPRLTVSLLFSGANAAGFLDQWDSVVHSTSELEVDIQRGKVQGILWFGEIHAPKVFDEYLKGMRVFVHAVNRLTEAHPRAHWAIPLESSLEKKGTYTNTFGRVQTIRRTVRLIEKGYEPFSMLQAFARKLGTADQLGVEQVYEELAKGAGYPKTMPEIAESKATYAHYERALWR
jgi:predicted molibdopterin-dependent oxidoreductase YjgC